MKQINRSTTPVNANRSSRKIGNGLVTLSSAAVLAVYSAGYLRTRSAADRLTLEAAQRRPPVPSPERAGTPPGRALDKTRPGAAPVTAVPATRVVEAPTAALAPAGPPRKAMAPARSAPAPLPSSKPVAATRRAIEQPAAATPAATVEASDTAPAAAAPPSVPLPAIAASEPAAPQPAALAATVPGKWKDGSYTGWGTSRHGDIEATVVVAGGRIASAVISQCLTRYSCSWIAPLPPQVAIRQSPEVDYVSGATQSTNAFYYAVVEALSKAK
ncbi:MAG: hypothetical protein ABJC89_06710 [Acidobacteriota bacterium]